MKDKKNFVLLLAILPFLLFTASCSDDDDDNLIGKWYRVSDFDGLARNDASSFTIGNKGYLVCGYQGKKRLNDLWEYDMQNDAWLKKADFPGAARIAAIAFTLDNKGYFGTGYDGENYLNDFWEYNPATDKWTQLSSFPGSARSGATAFGIDGKGYIGCGYDGNYLKDFYAFNPSSNSWEQIISIGGSKRRGATSFVINGEAYVCCGQNNGDYISDFWKYIPSTASWQQLRDIANTSDDDYDDGYNITRTNAVSFIIDGCAYLTCGESGSIRSDSWKYNPATDLWENVAKFKGTARTSTCSFSNGQRGYIVTGGSNTLYFDDIWEFHPFEYDDDDY